MTQDIPNISLESITKLNDDQISHLVHIFNRHSFVVVTLENPISIDVELLSLSSIFGAPCHHDRSDVNGIVTVAYNTNEITYLSASSKEHLMHTDGTFMETPPLVNALWCAQPSSCGGGKTGLLRASLIYQQMKTLYPVELAQLHQPDVLTVKRHTLSATHPVFQRIGNFIRMIYRNDLTASITISPDALAAFQKLNNIIHQLPKYEFTLHANQLLIMDNTAILHSRTAFQNDGGRLLYRLDMNGQSSKKHPLRFGFQYDTN